MTKINNVSVVFPSLHYRYSGVTSTIISLVPYHLKSSSVAVLGPLMPPEIPRVSFKEILKSGWSKPPKHRYRIWHARRNNDMVVGIFLKYILRQPWKLVFTWSGQRRQARLTRWFLRRMDAVITTSEAAGSYLEVPHTVIHHGIDIRRYYPAENKATAWSQTKLSGTLGIGVFGRIRPEKGTDLFVKAMIKLLPQYPEATAVITGLVEKTYQSFADELKQLIIKAGLEKRIIFLGERPIDEMPSWFRCISLYVAPMRWEGFGLTPLEAMASGTPVVATKTGAAPKLITEGKTGFLISPNDEEALYNAIELLLKSPEKMEAMGKAGREKSLQQHDINQEADAIQKVYERLWDND